MKRSILGLLPLILVLVFLCMPMGVWARETVVQPAFPEYCALCNGPCMVTERTYDEAAGCDIYHYFDTSTNSVQVYQVPELPTPDGGTETPETPGTKTDVGDANLQANAPTETDAFAQVTNDAQLPAAGQAGTPGNTGDAADNGDITKLPQVLAELPTALAVWWDGLPETENGVLIRMACIIAGALLVIAIVISLVRAIWRRVRRQRQKKEKMVTGDSGEPQQ